MKTKQQLIDSINEIYEKIKNVRPFSQQWRALKAEKVELMREYMDRYPESDRYSIEIHE